MLFTLAWVQSVTFLTRGKLWLCFNETSGHMFNVLRLSIKNMTDKCKWLFLFPALCCIVHSLTGMNKCTYSLILLEMAEEVLTFVIDTWLSVCNLNHYQSFPLINHHSAINWNSWAPSIHKLPSNLHKYEVKVTHYNSVFARKHCPLTFSLESEAL